MHAKQQRAALILLVGRLFPDTILECRTISWLAVPSASNLSGPLKKIFLSLAGYRGEHQFATTGWRLACDILIPGKKTIVEYDERQHFTAQRAIALRHYPRSISLGFDVAEWITHCETIDAKDSDPPYRDEQRAFYDSVRDLNAAANGFRMIRLKHGALDWTTKSAANSLSSILAPRRYP